MDKYFSWLLEPQKDVFDGFRGVFQQGSDRSSRLTRVLLTVESPHALPPRPRDGSSSGFGCSVSWLLTHLEIQRRSFSLHGSLLWQVPSGTYPVIRSCKGTIVLWAQSVIGGLLSKYAQVWLQSQHLALHLPVTSKPEPWRNGGPFLYS